MKRTALKQIGKRGKINIVANKKLYKIYGEKEIDYCEAKLEGCKGTIFGLTFHHKRKRYEYYNCIEKLAWFSETIRLCPACHERLERDKALSDKTFVELRGEEKVEQSLKN